MYQAEATNFVTECGVALALAPLNVAFRQSINQEIYLSVENILANAIALQRIGNISRIFSLLSYNIQSKIRAY
jgi:hypothetical protein